MALPEQIRKQTEAVQELYKQLNQGGEEAQPEATETENVETPTADGDSPATNEAQAPSEDKSVGEEDPNSETYAQRYRTLQGMYNAEVPRLHTQNRELQQRVQQLEQLLATMSATKLQQPAQTAAPVTLVTDEDRAEYGESIDMMRKVAREELSYVAQEIAALKNALAQLQMNVVPQVQSIATYQAQTAEQQFWSALAQAIPNWREINDNPDFQAWLLAVDPFTGITRQVLLEDAQRNLDVNRVINFFRVWIELNGGADAGKNSNRKAPASELERHVSPGKSRNTGAPSTQPGKIYTPEDIRKFFSDVRQGKYKGREAERDRIERDIFAAQREGRIVTH